MITFNCRGIQDPVKRRKVFYYLRTVIDSDIIFLQETHSSANDEIFWKQHWGEKAWFSSKTSNSRGVAILIRNHVSCVVNSFFADPDGRYLIMSTVINGLSLNLVNIYAPNNNDPDFFLEVFAKVEQFEYAPLICAGDFNAVLGSLDYQGSRQTHTNIKSRDMILTLMEEYNLCDIWRNFHPNLKRYTRHQKTPKVLSRLDYILVSNNFVNNCVQSNIQPGIQSDHSVVSLKFKDDQPARGPSFWKLNCGLLHSDAEFVKVVKEKIEEFKLIHLNSECNPNILWDALKCTIIGICIEYSSRKKKERMVQKDKLFKEIDEIKIKISNNVNDSSSNLIDQLDQLNDQLNKILDNETQGLIIRSRIRWVEEGEKSSKYFCNLEKRLGEKKSIFRIQKDDGDIVIDKDKILEEIQNFYQNLYAEQNPNVGGEAEEIFLDSIEIPNLNEDDKDFMERPISEKELYDILWFL